jgi:ABC-2 type transport system ATP-binding protein
MNLPLDTADGAADVLIALRQAGVTIASVSVSKPTLDEVFLALTGRDTGDAEQSDESSRNEPLVEAR